MPFCHCRAGKFGLKDAPAPAHAVVVDIAVVVRSRVLLKLVYCHSASCNVAPNVETCCRGDAASAAQSEACIEAPPHANYGAGPSIQSGRE